jgi:hypothetical protein
VVTGLTRINLIITTEGRDPWDELALRITHHAALLAVITACLDCFITLLAIGGLWCPVSTETRDLPRHQLTLVVADHAVRLSILTISLWSAVVVTRLALIRLRLIIAAEARDVARDPLT